MLTLPLRTGSGVATDSANGCDGYDPATILTQNVLTGSLPVYPPTDDDPTEFFQSVFFCIDNTPYCTSNLSSMVMSFCVAMG